MSKAQPVELSINNGPVLQVVGYGVWDILKGLNYNPSTFVEDGNIITYWKWIKHHPPVQIKAKKAPKELSTAMERKMAAWYKE